MLKGWRVNGLELCIMKGLDVVIDLVMVGCVEFRLRFDDV